jgi:hypothetical protein
LTALIYPSLRPLVPFLLDNSTVAVLLRNAMEAALVLTVLVLLYRLLHRGLRVRLVERIVVATSLTHFGWWRQYRAPKKVAAAPSTDGLASVQAVERPQ